MPLMRPERIQNEEQTKALTFPSYWTTKFVAINILGSFPKTPSCNQHVLFITNHCSKFTHATSMVNITSRHLETIFLDNWILLFGIPNYILSNNGPEFVGELFTMLCLFLRVKKLTNSANHLHTNSKDERYNRPVTARLSHYVFEYQKD